MRRIIVGVSCLALLVSGCSNTRKDPDGEDQSLGASPAGPRSPGPLADPPGHGWAWAAKPGTAFTDGLEVISLNPEVPKIQLTKVAFDAPACVEIIGAMVAAPERGFGAVQVLESWPPTKRGMRDAFSSSTVEPLAGANLDLANDPDGFGWELLIGIRSSCESTVTRRAIYVGYLFEGEEYTMTIPAELTINPV